MWRWKPCGSRTSVTEPPVYMPNLCATVSNPVTAGWHREWRRRERRLRRHRPSPRIGRTVTDLTALSPADRHRAVAVEFAKRLPQHLIGQLRRRSTGGPPWM